MHVVTDDTGVNGLCDLCCTGSFRTVTYHTGYDRNCIDHCMYHCIEITAVKVCDTCTCACTCAYGTAECGKTADRCLLVDGC